MELSTSKRLNIAVLDEQEVVRYGMYQRLSTERDFVIVGAYRCIADFIQALRYKPIDIVILDHMFQSGDALALIHTLKKDYPNVRILISSADDHPAVVALLTGLGADGYICKNSPLDQYVMALRAFAEERAADGPRQPTPVPIPADLAQAQDPHHEWLDGNALTAREKQVLRLCMRGLSVTQIAREFKRSLKTISSQKLSAYRKLGLNSDLELFRAMSSPPRGS
jgi:two-component system capsular synthesis response regulator RcsB